VKERVIEMQRGTRELEKDDARDGFHRATTVWAQAWLLLAALGGKWSPTGGLSFGLGCRDGN
jgi:hypothetical protein